MPSAFDTLLYGFLCLFGVVAASPVFIKQARVASLKLSIYCCKVYAEGGCNLVKARISSVQLLKFLAVVKCNVSARHIVTPLLVVLAKMRSRARPAPHSLMLKSYNALESHLCVALSSL